MLLTTRVTLGENNTRLTLGQRRSSVLEHVEKESPCFQSMSPLPEATSNKCIATSNKCLTSSNKDATCFLGRHLVLRLRGGRVAHSKSAMGQAGALNGPVPLEQIDPQCLSFCSMCLLGGKQLVYLFFGERETCRSSRGRDGYFLRGEVNCCWAEIRRCESVAPWFLSQVCSK